MENNMEILPGQSSPSQRVRRIAAILTSACVVVSVLVALYMLVQRFSFLHNDLQYDELYSVVTASPLFSLSYVLREMLFKDVNLPLFNVLLWGWNRIFPYTFFSMHLFSALLGVGAVVAAWGLAPKKWPWLKRCIFTTLMCSSFILVAYGSIIRAYSLFVLLTTVFTLMALRFVNEMEEGRSPAGWKWLVFFIVGLAASYTHFFSAGVFFITALGLFFYSLYYKIARAWVFFGTAVVFFAWLPWTWHVLLLQHGSSWWYSTPLMKSTWDMMLFLVGSLPMQYFLGIVFILAGVSLVSHYKKDIFKQAELVLPFMQIVLLAAVVLAISRWYNFWMDRYFLVLMPALYLLITACIFHLATRPRHWPFLALWPILLYSWFLFFFTFDYLHAKEYTGMRSTFNLLTNKYRVHEIMIDPSNMGYPEAAIPHMFAMYVPKGYDLKMIPLSLETAEHALTEPRPYIVMPVCGTTHLVYTSLVTGVEEDGIPIVFSTTCTYKGRAVDFKEGKGPMPLQKVLELDPSDASDMPGNISVNWEIPEPVKSGHGF